MEDVKDKKELLEKDKAASKEDIAHDYQDPMAKAREVLRESIFTKSGDGQSGKRNDSREAAKNPDDVLAFSRTVHRIDSSLE